MFGLKIKERRAGDVTILDLHGNIIIGEGAKMLDNTIKRIVEDGQSKILLNMSNVVYVDSCGLGHMISGFNIVRGEGGELKLLSPTKRVQELMIITKLLTVFDVYDEESAALASYN